MAKFLSFYNAVQIAFNECDWGTFNGHVGARAHGYTNIRLGQCRRIINTIARHGHHATLLLKLFNFI